MQFYKYHGTGNDFIFIEEPKNLEESFIQRICDRHFGIGADGLIFASKSLVADIKFNYYNSDGSIARMCGNGLRCFVKYLKEEKKILPEKFKVETLGGILDVAYDKETSFISINLKQASFYENTTLTKEELTIENSKIEYYKLELRTDHVVIFNQDNIKDLASKISTHKNFPNGTNVNFVTVKNDEEIFVHTYERGSSWTLSCGTGVSASAIISYLLNKTKNRINVEVQGGNLSILINKNNEVILTGSANLIAKGEYYGTK